MEGQGPRGRGADPMQRGSTLRQQSPARMSDAAKRVYEGARAHCMKHSLMDKMFNALSHEDVDKDGFINKKSLHTVFHKGLSMPLNDGQLTSLMEPC